jgi:hypothetical protein
MNTARCCLFALPLCLALVACDSQPDVRLLIHAPQPLAHDCLEQLPSQLSSPVPLAQVRRARPNDGVEYEVREPTSHILVFQDFVTNIIEVSLTSEGSPSPDQKRASLGLLKDMHHGVLRACNLDPAKVQVDRSCSGDACKDPSYPDL